MDAPYLREESCPPCVNVDYDLIWLESFLSRLGSIKKVGGAFYLSVRKNISDDFIISEMNKLSFAILFERAHRGGFYVRLKEGVGQEGT